jgi:hypothetical protein
MLTAFLTVTKRWKQSAYPEMDEGIYKSGLYIHAKKENSGKSYNMNEPRIHNAKCNEPVTKEQILYDSTCTQSLEDSNSWR